MTSSATFHRLALSSEALRLEKQDFFEKDRRYRVQFYHDFAGEIQYLNHLRTDVKERKEDDIKPPEPPRVPKKIIKKMHRKLAMLTHPDRHDIEDDGEFREIQEAYEAENGTALLAAAARHETYIEMDESDIQMLDQQLDAQRSHLLALKRTFHWAWAESDKSMRMRLDIRAFLGIVEHAFTIWRTQEGKEK